MVGLLAVELFLTKQGDILINEVAPRPHNSGHHTIECCMTSQFDQHLRSILDLPLGETELIIPGIMVNLVGENMIEGDVIYQNINDIFDIPGVFVHIYGKKKSRLNRKMGHITIVNEDIDKAIEIGKKIKKKITGISKISKEKLLKEIKDKSENAKIIYFDFETITNEEIHKPYK